MTPEKTEELLFEINGKLSSIETKLDLINDVVMKHESRITILEQKSSNNSNDGDFKNDMLKLLAKTVLIGTASLGVLVGAGSIISKLIGS